MDHLVDRRIPRRVDVHLVRVPVGYEPAPCVAYRAAHEPAGHGALIGAVRRQFVAESASGVARVRRLRDAHAVDAPRRGRHPGSHAPVESFLPRRLLQFPKPALVEQRAFGHRGRQLCRRVQLGVYSADVLDPRALLSVPSSRRVPPEGGLDARRRFVHATTFGGFEIRPGGLRFDQGAAEFREPTPSELGRLVMQALRGDVAHRVDEPELRAGAVGEMERSGCYRDRRGTSRRAMVGDHRARGPDVGGRDDGAPLVGTGVRGVSHRASGCHGRGRVIRQDRGEQRRRRVHRLYRHRGLETRRLHPRARHHPQRSPPPGKRGIIC